MRQRGVDRSQELKEAVLSERRRRGLPPKPDETLKPISQRHTSEGAVFLNNAKQLFQLLWEKERVLYHSKKAYMNITSFGGVVSSMSMSNADREALESDVLKFSREFDSSLSLLKQSLGETLNADMDQHCDLILLFLYARIKSLTETIREMKDLRNRRVQQITASVATHKLESDAISAARVALQQAEEERKSSEQDSNQFDFSPEEALMLENENKALLEELDSDMDAVRQAESRLVEISELFTLFSNKVVEQQQQIDNIYQNSVTANAHMERGLLQLLQSLQYGAHFRVNVLFFFVVAGLSLLFLDWYQD